VQYQEYEVDEGAGTGLIVFVYEDKRGWESVTISVDDKARLNTRRSLIDPEKSSPTVFTGVKPFHPSLRVEVDTAVEEISKVEVVDEATLDPST